MFAQCSVKLPDLRDYERILADYVAYGRCEDECFIKLLNDFTTILRESED